MNPETRSCQNCKNDFTIEPEDFSFYEKMKVPAPTWCPECRMIRRFQWRNNRSLHRRACALCAKVLISMYKDDGASVMCGDCYAGDAWDMYEHATDIDWSKDFFSQIQSLLKKQPRIFQYRVGTVVNSDYGNSVVNSKNAYMTFSVIDSENVMYSETIDKTKNSMDCLAVGMLDQCYWNVSSERNYNSQYMFQTQSCIDSYFLYDCTNCQQCCLSSNLRNQQYVFKNKKLSKEEYEKAVAGLMLHTRDGVDSAKREFDSQMKTVFHKYAQILASQNATGEFISNSKDVVNSFDVSQGSENIKNSARIINSKDVRDCYAILSGELEYETLSGTGNATRHISSILCLGSRDMEYSLFCKSSSNCFGCVGLKNAQYCILNKQYTKEEYEQIVPKLRDHMLTMPYIDLKGRVFTYGEFFPPEHALFGYNETIAQDYFPITKEAAKAAGYNWNQYNKRPYVITMPTGEIPNDITQVTTAILGEVIECAHKGECLYQCTNAFKITADELAFLKQKNIPIPDLCPNCRHFERLSHRNPYKLWHRSCMCEQVGHDHEEKCSNQFETSYAPERPELVYCESCYQKEVL